MPSKQAFLAKFGSIEDIDTSLNDKNEFIRKTAIYHPNVTKDHIKKDLKDKLFEIRKIAKERLKHV